ncbi:MAG: hypothetical protein CM1200mP2_24250 [Planctomycetaceae bacterium]|nr:MAG: hypothetical protein CM1200mP2_24250 [Planctomycetaceae bacterium]
MRRILPGRSVSTAHARLVGNLARLQLQVTGTDARGSVVGSHRGVSFSIRTREWLGFEDGGRCSPGNGNRENPCAAWAPAVEIPLTVSDFLPQAEVSFTRDVMPVSAGPDATREPVTALSSARVASSSRFWGLLPNGTTRRLFVTS